MLRASSRSALALQLENKSLAAPDMNIALPYEPSSVDHGVAVITTIKNVLAGVTTIFPDLTCDVLNHRTTLAGFES
jgi:hypothetical protein